MKLTVEVDITPDGEHCDDECLAIAHEDLCILCMLSMMTEQQGDVELEFDKRAKR